MLKLGTIPLVCDKESLEPGGAAFLLSSPPTKDVLFPLEGGEIEVRNGQPYVVARLAQALESTTAYSAGHKLIQEGLDLMSILGIHDAVIRDAEDEHLIWWSETAGKVLRAVSTTLLSFSVSPPPLRVLNKEGKEVSSTPSNPRHYIAFRFFRLAQTTDDLFDAYRNMYLAFEALLSSHHPKSDKEREIDWLRRALKSTSPVVRLAGLGVKPSGDIVETILETVYKDARLPLFHAKEGRPYFAPQDSSFDRRVVSHALGLLTQIVMNMAEVWYDVRRVGGGVFFGWVYENTRRLLAGASAYASSYDGPFDATEQDLTHPRFQTATKLTSRIAPEFQRGHEPAILSVASGQELSQINVLRRVELVSAGKLIIAHLLEAPLELDGISRFEDLMHIRGMNVRQPRTLFRE